MEETRQSCAAEAAEVQQQLAGLQLGNSAQDIITLNVGGRLFSTLRATLCLVEESLLGLMFSGRWPQGAAPRDSAGHVFLDVDPELFEVVLNWLRKFSMSKGAAGPLQHQAVHEPDVPPDKLEHMLALLDYLQLHRHVPLRYRELFNPQACSPFMTVHGNTATRTKTAATCGRKATGGVRRTLMQFAVSQNVYFDMAIDITLEAASFGSGSSSSGSTGNTGGATSSSEYMFVGFIHRDAVALLDPTGNINTQLTKLPSCYGWLTGRNVGYQVRNGKRSAMPCERNSLLWQQGQQVVLSLDCRRERGQSASLSLTNVATGLTKTMIASPTINAGMEEPAGTGSSSSSRISSVAATSGNAGMASAAAAAALPGGAGGAGGGQGEQQQGPGRGSKKRAARPGRRHRAARFALAAGPGRDEVLDLLQRQPAGVDVQVGELVAGAALQLLEARGFDVDEALGVLRQPGWLARLAQQVREFVVQNGDIEQQQQQQQQQQPAGPAPASDGADTGAAQRAAAAGGPNNTAAAAAAAAGPLAGAQHPQAAAALKRLQLPSGQVLPQNSLLYEWVLVVGLVCPSDSVRIVSARRRGQCPGVVATT